MSRAPLRLAVEIDFDLNRGQTTLFFFDTAGGDRIPLRFQELYNLAASTRRNPNTLPPDDVKLLKFLAPELGDRNKLRRNLLAITIAPERWRRIREAFGHRPDRFIERGSGKAYSARLPAAKLFFEVQCGGAKTLLAAVVDTPDGATRPWCRVRESMRRRPPSRKGDGDEIIEITVDGQILELKLPISLDVLNQVFGRDNPRVPSDAVVKNLPSLVMHRLDLLRGPSIGHDRHRVEPEIHVSSRGADLVVEIRAGRVALRLGDASMRLVRKGDRFVVTEFACAHWERIQRLFEGVPAREEGLGYVLPGDPDTLKIFVGRVRQLSDVPVKPSPDLKRLFAGAVKLETHVKAKEGRGWLRLSCQIVADGVELEQGDLKRAAARGQNIFRTRAGEWLQIDTDDLDQVGGMIERGVLASRPVPTVAAKQAFDQLGAWPNLRLDRSAADLAASISGMADVGPIPLNEFVRNTLRSYQCAGADFLYNRCSYGVGCLLADDMGLGKTLQTLASVDALHLDGPALVVCPASVVHVWEAEAVRFFPHMRTALLLGTAEQRAKKLGASADLLVCSYAVLRNDAEALRDRGLGMLILDEAQQIKNPDAQVTRAAKSIEVDCRVALSGTPLENRLTDLWSIVDFLNPGYLGREKEFAEVYGRDFWRRQELPERIAPLMLRRTKDEVAPELPPRTEESLVVPLSSDEVELYRAEVLQARRRAVGGNRMQIFAALTRLRQLCCHPRLLDEDYDGPATKFEQLVDMVDELLGEGHSVLVFSQFTSMLALIEERLQELNIPHHLLTGETPAAKRPEIVDRFTGSDNESVFLLSLKAAGTGLTLNRADYVILYDPWWNPAAERQAIDRTHRIGQDKPVIAYRLLAEGTVEEKVRALQEEKQQLFDEMIEGATAADIALDAAELAALLDFSL